MQGFYLGPNGDKYPTRDEVFAHLRTQLAAQRGNKRSRSPSSSPPPSPDRSRGRSPAGSDRPDGNSPMREPQRRDSHSPVRPVAPPAPASPVADAAEERETTRAEAHEAAAVRASSFAERFASAPQSLLPGGPPSGVWLGPLLVERLGRIEAGLPGHSAWDFIWPVGFRAKRVLQKHGTGRDVKVTLQISQGPKFIVLLELGAPGEAPSMVSTNTPDGAMRMAYSKLGYTLTPDMQKIVQPFLPPEVREREQQRGSGSGSESLPVPRVPRVVLPCCHGALLSPCCRPVPRAPGGGGGGGPGRRAGVPRLPLPCASLRPQAQEAGE